MQDKPGAAQLLQRCAGAFTRLQVIFADGAYKGPMVTQACRRHHNCRIEIIQRSQTKGFKVLPKRWIVERTFAWIGRNRLLSKDYEELPSHSEAFVLLAILRLIVPRITK